MALASSSADVVGSILFYLDAFAVTNLIQCGCAPLNAKIMQSCKNLELRTFPLMKFPFSLFNFPNVTSLLLDRHLHSWLYPLRLNGALPLPSTPVKSILRFSLSCTQCFSVLRLENGIPLLSIYMPNLKSLVLRMSGAFLSEDHMQAVPQGLECLDLRSRYVPTSTAPIPISSLYNLPPSLSSLNIFAGPIATDKMTNDYSTIVWPSQLTSLTLRLVRSCMIFHLPPHLETLSLTLFCNGLKNTDPPPISTHNFPTSLTDLRILNLSKENLKFGPTTFPPALKHCAITFDYSSPTAPGWSQLPKTLTMCSTDADFPKVGTFVDKLPNLTRFSGFYRFGDPQSSGVPELPRNLTILNMSQVSLAEIPALPASIVDLHVSISPLSAASPLPSNLPRNDVTRLPPFLRTLELHNASTTENFCKADFVLLPQTLTDLGISLSHIQDVEALKALPKSLKTISIGILPETSEILISDFLLFEALPTGLINIHFGIEHRRTAWERWMLSTPRFPALEKLFISFDAMGHQIDPISLNYLSSLPDTINDLEIPVHQTTMTPELMSGLPKYLTSLSIYSVGTVALINQATDDCFGNLPKTLVALTLPRDLHGLTSNVIPLLPTSIASLTLPSNIHPLSSTFFAREPEWNGFVPNH